MPVKVSFPSPSPHRVFDARDRDIERYPNRSWEHGYCILSKSATEARVLGIDVQEVVAVPTAEVVGSYPTVQHIVATIAYERIVANPSSQHIVATAPGEDIRAGTTIQREGRSRGCTGEGVAPVPPMATSILAAATSSVTPAAPTTFMTSNPASPFTLVSAASTYSVSSPAQPLSTSTPRPPLRMSLPPWPVRVSLPSPPASTFAASLPTSTFARSLPSRRGRCYPSTSGSPRSCPACS